MSDSFVNVFDNIVLIKLLINNFRGVINWLILNKFNIEVYWLNMKVVKEIMNIFMINCIFSVLINCWYVLMGYLIDFLFCFLFENWIVNSLEEISLGRRN